MAGKQPVHGKKLFTPSQANQALPLVRAIVRDIADLARDLRERHERVERLLRNGASGLGQAYQEELQQLHSELQGQQEQMREYIQELSDLGVELKDPNRGLVDFPAWINDHEVYLCWRLGEPQVNYWHELEAGFAGRRKLVDAEQN